MTDETQWCEAKKEAINQPVDGPVEMMRCELPAGHAPPHQETGGSGRVTRWDDLEVPVTTQPAPPAEIVDATELLKWLADVPVVRLEPGDVLVFEPAGQISHQQALDFENAFRAHLAELGITPPQLITLTNLHMAGLKTADERIRELVREELEEERQRTRRRARGIGLGGAPE